MGVAPIWCDLGVWYPFGVIWGVVRPCYGSKVDYILSDTELVLIWVRVDIIYMVTFDCEATLSL